MVFSRLCLPGCLQLVLSEICCNYYLVKIFFAIYCSFTTYKSCAMLSAFGSGSVLKNEYSTITWHLSVRKVMVWRVKTHYLSFLPPSPTFIFCFFSQIAEHIHIFFPPLHPKIWLHMGRRSTPQACSKPQPMLATPSLVSLMASQHMVRYLWHTS